MNMQVLDARRDVGGGYKVDVSRGQCHGLHIEIGMALTRCDQIGGWWRHRQSSSSFRAYLLTERGAGTDAGSTLFLPGEKQPCWST